MSGQQDRVSTASHAITAGLLTGAVLSFPEAAWAAELGVSDLAALPYTQFLLGCACGAAVTGIIAAGVHVAGRGHKMEASISQGFAEAGSDPVRAKDSLNADAGRGASSSRVQHGAKNERPSRGFSSKYAAARELEDTAEFVAAAGAAHGVASPQAQQSANNTSTWPKPQQQPSQTADLADFAQSYVRKNENAKRATTRSRGVRSVLAERFGKNMFDDLPVIQRADGSVGDVGTDWWDKTLGSSIRHVGEQEPAAASSVSAGYSNNGAAVQQSRTTSYSGASSKTNQPAAQRSAGADSLSVPAWASRARDYGAAASASPSKTTAQAASGRGASSPQRKAEARRRALYIARNVAEIDEGVYPAKRTSDELDQGDMWEQALAAMSQRLDQDAHGSLESQDGPLFQARNERHFADTIGGADTIDDPEGLEPQTSFIPFRVPADHPEVVDTDSYVDYLIDQEFSRNQSQAARASSRNYLTVLEGGTNGSLKTTNPLRSRRRASDRKHQTASSKNVRAQAGEYRPKHMAPAAAQAREA